jgi:LuxR family maltose regulon positive regulatory protein
VVQSQQLISIPGQRAVVLAPVPDRRVVRSSGFVPVEAKLHPPIAREGFITRDDAVGLLSGAEQLPVVLVTGPPGAGKTTVLAQWAGVEDRPVAWLTLDQADNDPVVLVTYLLLVLQRIEPTGPGELASLTGGDVAFSTVMLPRLGRLLGRRSRPFVLVLDDAHLLTSPAALEVVRTLANNLPPGSALAVAGRQAPDLPWHRLRVRRQLLELGPNELRLSPTESAALLEAVGLDPARHDVAALHERTEGWAAGLYLAALSLRSRGGRPAGPDSVAGDDRVVSEYLRDELLASLAPDLQEFLLRSSLLEQMSGPLCDAVLETTGSGLVLQQLERSNLLVIPLDDEGRWYRFHHLFAEMLQAELERREPERIPDLHARASRWLEGAGDPEAAIAHARACGDTKRAAQLLWSQVARCLDLGRQATVERWLGSFDSTDVVSHSWLALSAGWVAFARGRPVEHWLSAAERGLYDDSLPGESDAIAGAAALLRAALARRGVAAMGEDARSALALQAPDDPWRCLASYLRGVSLHLVGERGQATALLEETRALSEAMDLRAPHALALAQLAALAVEDNSWQLGEQLVREAQELMGDSVLDTGGVRSLSMLLLSRAGRVDEARREFRLALRSIALNEQLAPWDGVQSRSLLARGQLLLGDSSAARVLLAEAQVQLKATSDAVVLRENLDELWRQAEQAPLGLGAGPTMLTTAELRVLQYLPTHLSFEQISQRLFVSRNTVKTQAIAAYRKLGVTSRSDAVERAAALGLVDL